MATAEGLALLERHRAVQGQIARLTATQMLQLFPLLLSGRRIDANTTRWLEAVLAVMAVRRAQSAGAAALYMSAYRTAEIGALANPFAFEPKIDLNSAQATTSMMVLGPNAYKAAVAKQLDISVNELSPQHLIDNPLPPGLQQKLAANSARAAIRHATNGGRDTIDDAIRRDQRVVGYVRTVRADPCWFCAMLASRGPVYAGDSFEDSDPRFHGPGDQKVHDGCGCSLAPLYSRDNPDFLAQTREFEEIWKRTGSALRFRQEYEGRSTSKSRATPYALQTKRHGP